MTWPAISFHVHPTTGDEASGDHFVIILHNLFASCFMPSIYMWSYDVCIKLSLIAVLSLLSTSIGPRRSFCMLTQRSQIVYIEYTYFSDSVRKLGQVIISYSPQL